MFFSFVILHIILEEKKVLHEMFTMLLGTPSENSLSCFWKVSPKAKAMERPVFGRCPQKQVFPKQKKRGAIKLHLVRLRWG